MIVPDSIDPYVGYKALRIDRLRQLVSPTYQVGWPKGSRFEATCPGQGWNWTLVEGIPPPQPFYGPTRGISYQHGYDPRYYQTTSFSSSHTSPSSLFPGPKPDFEPPDGFYWDWQLVAHTPADPDCSCGVYAVDHIEGTFSYVHPDCVVCEIAMWGQVTIGEHGARGQYAYPTKMYVPDHLKTEAVEVAAAYEIEWVPQPFTVGKQHGEFVSHPLRDTQADARVAAAAFSLFAALAMLISTLTRLADVPIVPTVFLIMGSGFFALFLLAFYDSRQKPA